MLFPDPQRNLPYFLTKEAIEAHHTPSAASRELPLSRGGAARRGERVDGVGLKYSPKPLPI